MNKKIMYIIAIVAFFIVLVLAVVLLNTKNDEELGENNQIENKADINMEQEKQESNVKHVTSEDFEKEVLESEKPVLIDFFATWCGPCKILSPIVEEISKENDKIKVVKIDVDQETKIANKYRIQGMPTLVLIKDGKEAKRIMGLQNKQALNNFINNNI